MMKVQIILAGVGGQGILFASKLFSELGLRLGLGVLGSETHGMSQRGGSVIAHLKLGDFQSPLVREGRADILYSFDRDETYRTVKFLRDGGVCFSNLPDGKDLDREIEGRLGERGILLKTFDADAKAMEIGAIVSANIVLIGFSVGTGLVPFESEDLRLVLKRISPEKFVEKNLNAFDIGLKAGRESAGENSGGSLPDGRELQKARNV